MKFLFVLAIASTIATVQAAWPAAKGSVTLSKPQRVTGVFDCGLKRYQLNKKCNGQTESGEESAVFV